ncbi:unnamed protein product [Arctogadus glacialis]
MRWWMGFGLNKRQRARVTDGSHPVPSRIQACPHHKGKNRVLETPPNLQNLLTDYNPNSVEQTGIWGAQAGKSAGQDMSRLTLSDHGRVGQPQASSLILHLILFINPHLLLDPPPPPLHKAPTSCLILHLLLFRDSPPPPFQRSSTFSSSGMLHLLLFINPPPPPRSSSPQ